MSSYPKELKYLQTQEWIKKDGDLFLVGISEFAQSQLGDIVYVDMPEEGDEFDKNTSFGELESSKAVSEINMPFNGEIIEINEELEDSPELINSDPYGTWIVRIKATDTGDFDSLLSSDEIEKYSGEE